MEVSRELENDCLISETGAELFMPHSENRRKVAEKHREEKNLCFHVLRNFTKQR